MLKSREILEIYFAKKPIHALYYCYLKMYQCSFEYIGKHRKL